MSTTTRTPKTTTVPRANAHVGNFYKAKLGPNLRAEALDKPYGWGIMRREQIGCQIASKMLAAEVGREGKRVVSTIVARALFSTAGYGFNGSNTILHIAGKEPSYRNVRLPRIDLRPDVSPAARRQLVIDRLAEQDAQTYPTILRSLETGNIFTPQRIVRNARVLAECSLELASIPVTELYLANSFDIQDLVAMSANSLKTSVAMATARDQQTPSVSQFVDRGSPVYHEMIASSVGEVSDLALEVCRDL